MYFFLFYWMAKTYLPNSPSYVQWSCGRWRECHRRNGSFDHLICCLSLCVSPHLIFSSTKSGCRPQHRRLPPCCQFPATIVQWMRERHAPSKALLVDSLSPAMLNEANRKILIPRRLEFSQKTSFQVLYIYELTSI